jgi:thioredoxin reductase (NADPH)
VRLNTEVTAVEAGDGGEVESATLRARGGDGASERIPATAVFACIGGTPRTAWADDTGVAHDRAGFILTGPDLLDHGERPAGWPLQRDPLALETSVPGLFAAGDARHGSTKRVAGAVGDGAMATALAHRRLAELRTGS